MARSRLRIRRAEFVHGHASINLIPLIDILTAIVFFSLLSVVTLRSALASFDLVQPPAVAEPTPSEPVATVPAPELVVRVDADRFVVRHGQGETLISRHGGAADPALPALHRTLTDLTRPGQATDRDGGTVGRRPVRRPGSRARRSSPCRSAGRLPRNARAHAITVTRQPRVPNEASAPTRVTGMDTEVLIRRFDAPDEVREMIKGRFEIVRLAGLTIGRATYEPGWRWSEHVGPTVGAERCTVEHVGLVLAGTAVAAFDDGTIVELRAGELFYIPPTPHDSWVVGDTPYVSLHLLGAGHYAR